MTKEILLIASDHYKDLYCVIGFGSFFQKKIEFNDIDILFIGNTENNYELYKKLKSKYFTLSKNININIDFNFLTKKEFDENLYLDIKNGQYLTLYLNPNHVTKLG